MTGPRQGRGDRRARWHDGARTLEVRKDGVRFRPLEETLAVDAVVVIRPRLGEASMARGLERAAAHEGEELPRALAATYRPAKT